MAGGKIFVFKILNRGLLKLFPVRPRGYMVNLFECSKF